MTELCYNVEKGNHLWATPDSPTCFKCSEAALQRFNDRLLVSASTLSNSRVVLSRGLLLFSKSFDLRTTINLYYILLLYFSTPHTLDCGSESSIKYSILIMYYKVYHHQVRKIRHQNLHTGLIITYLDTRVTMLYQIQAIMSNYRMWWGQGYLSIYLY